MGQQHQEQHKVKATFVVVLRNLSFLLLFPSSLILLAVGFCLHLLFFFFGFALYHTALAC